MWCFIANFGIQTKTSIEMFVQLVKMSSPLKKLINNTIKVLYFVNSFYPMVAYSEIVVFLSEFVPDFSLNRIISGLLEFKDILFALDQLFRGFRTWLIFLLIFSNHFSDCNKLILSAKRWTGLNLITLFRSFLSIRKTSVEPQSCGTPISMQTFFEEKN